jgi:hypothetical protein
MPKFYVNRQYERTSAIRRANRLRRKKVNDRLTEAGVAYALRDSIYTTIVIPDNIRRLITILEE